jgi:hypothetical protein
MSTIAHFGSKTHKLIGTNDTEETQGIMRGKNAKVLLGVPEKR